MVRLLREDRLSRVVIERVGLAEDSHGLRIAGCALDVGVNRNRHIIDRAGWLGWGLHW